MLTETTFLVIGGGIAGVSCVENVSLLSPDESITIVSASPLIKAATNVLNLTQTMQSFDVEETTPDYFDKNNCNVKFINEEVIKLHSQERKVQTTGNHVITYRKLCICSGARPKVIEPSLNSDLVIGLRDTETVRDFQRKLSHSRKVVIVGNGGIATELAWAIRSCEVVWAIKDLSIGTTFFDAGAAEFFLRNIDGPKLDAKTVKRMKYQSSDEGFLSSTASGSALGPDWSETYALKGQSDRSVQIEYDCTVVSVCNHTAGKEKWPLYITLSNGKIIGCDILISATGVVPNTERFTDGNDFTIADDSGLKVDSRMRTNIPDIYAAGDACTASWENAKHWFQMRLWTQARQMGHYAAKCMVADLKGEEMDMDFCFELFTHVTKFFDYKVILLGLFNGQDLPKDGLEYLVRISKGREYVKVVMQDGRMQGAVLVGETDLEETFENLILNQMDLSSYGENLLDPNVDIEDYFD